ENETRRRLFLLWARGAPPPISWHQRYAPPITRSPAVCSPISSASPSCDDRGREVSRYRPQAGIKGGGGSRHAPEDAQVLDPPSNPDRGGGNARGIPLG